MEFETNMRISLLFMLTMHLLLYIVIGFDVFLIRQIIVFVYISFIPGYVLLKTIKLKEDSIVDTILFSVGLSITFLMFVGLLLNQLCLILEVAQPLSTIPLVITISFLTLTVFLIGYRKDLLETFSSIDRNSPNSKTIIARAAIVVLPIILGIVGGLYISKPIIVLMIIAIAALYALSAFLNRFVSSELYPFVIFAISLALVFHVLLTSRYIIGWDAQIEYYVFKLTSNNGHWSLLNAYVNSANVVNFNSMLSVTILPTIYSALLNINGEIIFKTLYPFVFSLVPVTLYQIFERQIGKLPALFSTLFFISGNIVFYGIEPLSLNRQVVAMFLMLLWIFVLLDKKISVGKRRLLLIVFGAAMVVSHYALTLIFLAIISSVYAISKIKGSSDKVLNITIVSLLFIMAFSWYTISLGPLISLSRIFSSMFSSLITDLFNPAVTASPPFGPGSVLTFATIVNWIFAYAAHFLIVVGILVLVFKPAKTRLDPKQRMLSIVGAGFLFLSFAIPYLARAINFSRFYAITLLFIVPCFALGGEALADLAENLLKRVTSRNTLSSARNRIGTVVLCTVLIGYFFSQSGFINYITGGIPQSSTLDSDRWRTSPDLDFRMRLYGGFIVKEDAFGAVWLSKHIDEQSKVYSDYLSRNHVLLSVGLIPLQKVNLLYNRTIFEPDSLIYLGQLNIASGRVVLDRFYGHFNTSEISPILNENNVVYSNGNSSIWQVPSTTTVGS